MDRQAINHSVNRQSIQSHQVGGEAAVAASDLLNAWRVVGHLVGDEVNAYGISIETTSTNAHANHPKQRA
jgi:hypothetical protein